MKKYKTSIIWVIVVVVAFAGGWYIGQNTAPAAMGRAGYPSSTRGGFGARTGAGGGFAAGTVTAIDSNSITLQLANGNSENVFYSSSTSVIEPQPASISAVKLGVNVMVGGATDSAGNLTASSIQIRNGNGPAGAPRPAGN
jgi:hypothetical protein